MSKEYSLQIACVKWFYIKYPNHLIYAIPNEGKRSLAYGYQLKEMGLLAGMPDLCIPPYLYIEFKRPSGQKKVRQKQMNIHRQLRRAGCLVEIMDSEKDFKRYVDRYLSSKKRI
jgi:hypothetical protein